MEMFGNFVYWLIALALIGFWGFAACVLNLFDPYGHDRVPVVYTIGGVIGLGMIGAWFFF